MQATKALTHSQRASQALVALQITAITFDMIAMVGRHPPQLKMPRLDAYVGLADPGHLATICRSDLAVVALSEDEQITTFVLHKRKGLGLSDGLKLFVANAEDL